MKLTSPGNIKRIMADAGLRFHKSLGQNFLIDDGVLQDIVCASGVTEQFGVIEIGPGLGVLTTALSDVAKKVCAVEIDRSLASYLQTAFETRENVSIVQADALKTDFFALINGPLAGLPVAVVANLPYYITSPIVMKLLEDGLPLQSITVMVQKEVADRMTAQPGSKQYGALSVAVQYHSRPQLVRRVAAGCFMPPPQVESAVVKLDIAGHQKPFVSSEEKLFRLVKAAFGQRRKTLVNALGQISALPKEQLQTIVTECCGDPSIRGEKLSLEQMIQLCERLEFSPN